MNYLSRFFHYDSLEDIEEKMWLITGDTEAIGVIEALIKEVKGLENAVDSLRHMMWER